jgi:hypothetical protein
MSTKSHGHKAGSLLFKGRASVEAEGGEWDDDYGGRWSGEH